MLYRTIPLLFCTISYCAVLCHAVLPPTQILTYTEAVKTVDHDKALGKPNSLWIAFAKFYEKHGDVDNARVIFNKATQVRGRCGWSVEGVKALAGLMVL
jgi:hypothetical protein